MGKLNFHIDANSSYLLQTTGCIFASKETDGRY